MKMATNPPKFKVPLVDDERLQNLKNAFERHYGETPLFYACAPGRVNLIGEHIDYCGFSVLPMAIEQNIFAAVSVNNLGTIQLANINPLYNNITVSCSEEIVIDRTNPKWYYYFLCGVKGIQEKFGITRLPGMSCVIDGNVPPSSGLSSSSALVCCAGLVTMEANQKSLSKLALAEICAKCERYIGTEGGGMDQSISFLAEKGTAKLIEFEPLRAIDVQLPAGAVFVISNCCLEMNKAASSHFNIRVVECRIATKMLGQAKGLNQKGLLKLAQVQTELKASLEEMLLLVDEVLHPEPYSREEICKALDITSQQFSTELLSANTQHVTHFKLYQRAKHVYGEASRVLRFKDVCDCEAEESIQLLGDLMNQSHASCRDLYECSCPELDQLVDICLKSGAVGSRLTGAGWGGCAVSMVPSDKVQSFVQAVREAYYLPDPRRAAMEKQSLFVSKPGGGAAIYVEN
ncbi:N-acetylgalactosamine kinase isoform X1 [Corythoichthys intestinalis]|uniref:N-acetylgalactosamine kinase isoform X1 n=2 Tax=Corythoichthys intestinalis TaxID=161448 RepID=UPI0025A5AE87|nr:N-acetylgalactosamine kinase isoform X1 [Corythoichthys intestinalis]XP_057693055.1 N-acetylgalactosamine kinase isoform X1 [Corythoichthys intestinalis]XP_057693056.1 N-acetylgalactosamine kinase isoform X1 [Corythoichthys intestinalis]